MFQDFEYTEHIQLVNLFYESPLADGVQVANIYTEHFKIFTPNSF